MENTSELNVRSNRFTQVATALHLSEKARSAEWCNK